MRLAALVSGGKDSLYAMYLAMQTGHDVRYIISFISENPDSYMFHVPNAGLVKKQAELIGIKHFEISTKGVKEEELADIEKVLKKILPEIDGVVTGAVASNYQKIRIDAICKNLGLQSIAPLWGRNDADMLREIVNNGFEIMIVAVAAPPLDESWLGCVIDEERINELAFLNKKYGISAMGEGGEFETLVIDCPMFKKSLVVKGEKYWNDRIKHGVFVVRDLNVIEK
ncbi:MAG: diphthine--ammonia ligase [Candidatus Aenigmarchaeota archaeon]|nr:diphthine--ammonia ligase [Candidatus Aenigmarchaeota archaeon]